MIVALLAHSEYNTDDEHRYQREQTQPFRFHIFSPPFTVTTSPEGTLHANRHERDPVQTHVEVQRRRHNSSLHHVNPATTRRCLLYRQRHQTYAGFEIHRLQPRYERDSGIRY